MLIISLMLWVAGSARGQVAPAAQASGARDCATCHLSWVESYRRPGAVLLIDRPSDSYVSSSESCLGCHDGAVDDDRRHVWLEHGHKTGITPPSAMRVPEALPLLDGKIACRTCHTAHAGTGPETIATTFFLRMPNDKGQLCMSCHTDYARDPQHGTHPIGPMELPLPEVLAAAGARAGTDHKQLNCRSCHTPHGQKEDHLLVMPASNRQLCLACHQQINPALFGPDRKTYPHPQNPRLETDAQREAIRSMKTHSGGGDTLICLSCHSMHKAKSPNHILADTLENSALCIRCHPGYDRIAGSDHDLRKSAPEAVNLLRESAQTSGPCGSCHGVHHVKREPAPAPADPAGLCLACHRQGQCAEKKTGQPISHPIQVRDMKLPENLPLKLFSGPGESAPGTIACLTCHNPHETGHAHFLREENATLCSTCHVDKAEMAGAPHDFTGHDDWKNGRGWTTQQTGTCSFCHGVHNAKGPALWVATPDAPRSANELCVNCHRPGGLGENTMAGELRHPTGPLTAAARSQQVTLPLFDGQGNRSPDGFVACATCHNPHRPRLHNSRLRLPPREAPETLCITCHVQTRPLPETPHALEVMHEQMHDLPELGRHTTCGPCHSTHAQPGMAGTGMWRAPLAANYPRDMAECLGCHSPAGGATLMTPTIHPAALIQNVVAKGQPGYMPVFDDQGQEAPAGRISCRTCHLPHGREDLTDLLTSAQLVEELRALNPLVRIYVPPNLCSSCHGAEGLSHFLFYHHPALRQTATTPATR